MSQPIGINTFRIMLKKIAQFLNLPDFGQYTGHCLRRTSATLLADTGVDIQVLKRHGVWRSSTIAEGYIEKSIENKVRTSKKIFEHASTITTSSTTDDKSSTTDDMCNTTDDMCNIIDDKCSTTNDKLSIINDKDDISASHTTILNTMPLNDINIATKTNLDFNKTGTVHFSNINNCIFNIYNGIEK